MTPDTAHDDTLDAEAAEEAPVGSPELLALLERFGNSRLELSCDLGQTSMNLHALLALEEGSVVRVHRATGEDLGLRLNGQPFGRADVMVVESRVLLRITEVGHRE